MTNQNENLKKSIENHHINNEFKLYAHLVNDVSNYDFYQSELILRDKEFKNNMIQFIQELTE